MRETEKKMFSHILFQKQFITGVWIGRVGKRDYLIYFTSSIPETVINKKSRPLL